MSELTHVNDQGRARMVDISEKESTVRKALARSSIEVTKEIYNAIHEGTVKKGDVLSVAQVAGIMAAKKTSELIPMCHPIALTGVDIHFKWETDPYHLTIYAEAKTKGSTGVEMEALTAVSVAALTVYDMCKSMSKAMVIGQTFLVNKSGGKSGDFNRSSE